MINFASDNVTGACPEIMDAMMRASVGPAMPYGNDPLTTKVQDRLRKLFEKPGLIAHPVATGTACNSLALACISPVFGAIYCHEDAHINLDECGAPEVMTNGAKLIPLAGDNGKLTVETLDRAIQGAGVVHHVQPAVVSLSQVTESGTVYSLEELQALSQLAHDRGLKVHMDGARFANALVALDCTAAELTWKAGIDVLSFGGTKNGCWAAEAVIFFNPDDARDFGFHRKRFGHLFSKMRAISSQLDAYLDEGLWLKNARHANAMARKMIEGFRAAGYEEIWPVEANEVFVRISAVEAQKIQDAGYFFYHGILGEEGSRMVLAWNSRPEDVEGFIEAARQAKQSAA